MEIISTIAHKVIAVTDPSHVGEVRRAAKNISHQLTFSEEQAGKLAIIVTEAATNLIQHAGKGEVLLCPYIRDDGEKRIDVIALDKGPGISDMSRSMEDGFSTAGTKGNGLGAIRRLADKFEMHSQARSGTVVLARIAANARPRELKSPKLLTGFVCVPTTGEQLSGDSVGIRASCHQGMFMVADGLGHGVSANEASLLAARIFSEEKDSSPAALLDSLHNGLRATRGAAVAVASIDCEAGRLRYSGVGNIAGGIFKGEQSRSLISHNGIVGHQSHKIQEFEYDWPSGGMLIMNSDGIVTNWRLNQYPGVMQKDPAIIAALLYRDFGRGRDDVGILVVKENTDA